MENMSERPASMEKEPITSVRPLDGRFAPATKSVTIQPPEPFRVSRDQVFFSGDQEGLPHSKFMEVLKASGATRVEITRSGGEKEEISVDDLAEQLAV